MKLTKLAAVAAVALTAASPALADLVFPSMSYRTGAFAAGGIPFADGYQDYFTLLNERDGGIGGEKISVPECETGYNTEKGVECYESLKGLNPLILQPLSTGITYQLIPKVTADGIPLHTMGYGRTSAANGKVFKWVFNYPGNYWDAASIMVKHALEQEGGSLEGKSIVLLYHNSAYGKEPIRTLEELSKKHGFKLTLIPVDSPGQEQKSQWLQIRREKPDYVFFWGWGVMNQVAVQEAANIRFPMDHFVGVWWSGAEPDVKDVGAAAKGYSALTMQDSADANSKIIKDIMSMVHDKGQGTGPKEEVGQVLYMRGLSAAMMAVEGVRRAQEKYGKGKIMTGEQVRWGYENLNLDQKSLDGLGFAGVMRPVSTSCADHMGASWARIRTWDGAKWGITSDWYQADDSVIKPLVKKSADKYLSDKKLQRRAPADCQS